MSGNNWKNTNRKEMMHFFGLLIFARVYKPYNEALMHLWSINNDRPVINKLLDMKRLTEISQCNTFRDVELRHKN